MNVRFGKILIFVLCGALLLIAGCATTAPSGGAAPTPAAGGPTPQAGASAADLGTVISLLRTIDERVSLVAENTRPESKDLTAGNIVLFDSAGSTADGTTSGSAVVTLPRGRCVIGVYSGMTMTTTVEELSEISREREYRNRQPCVDDSFCRKTVTLDDSYPFLYVEFRPSQSSGPLTRVTLSYRCQAT
jgi:hypothetical protein